MPPQDDSSSLDETYDAIYDIVFDQLKWFYKDELKQLGIYENKPEHHDKLFPIFEVYVDRIIRAKEIGELNTLQNRSARKEELDQVEKILNLIQIASLDELSEKLLTITAANQQYESSHLDKLKSFLEELCSLIRNEELGQIIEPILNARRDELLKQDAHFGRTSVVPTLVAEECRVIWFMATGQKAKRSFKSIDGKFDQHFPMFVDDIFQKLFEGEKQPSTRTALEKSSASAFKRIEFIGSEKSNFDFES